MSIDTSKHLKSQSIDSSSFSIDSENLRTKNFKKKNVEKFDKLKVLINALSSIHEGSVLNNEKRSYLNVQNVYDALNEIVGGMNGLAYVILDDANGSIFSQDLIEEANASFKCLKKLQVLIENDGGKLIKPVIIVTGVTPQVQVVLIMPRDYLTIECNKKATFVFFVDPTSGQTDIKSQTVNSIFEMYLRKGSNEKGIPPLFANQIEAYSKRGKVKKCNLIQDSGFWCIYYCVMLLHNGNDSFLEESNWATDNNANILKSMLQTHVVSISNLNDDIEMEIDKKSDFNIQKLKQIDDEIQNDFRIKEENIKKKIGKIKMSSLGVKIKELLDDVRNLDESRETLKQELSVLEKVIKESEALLTTKRNQIDTTETKYRRFITGEEKRMLEENIEKKEAKACETLLAHSEGNRQTYVENKIVELEKHKLEESVKLKENLDRLNMTIQEKDSSLNRIKELENKRKSTNDRYRVLLSSLAALSSTKGDLEKIASEINRILLTNHEALISRLLNNDIKCDKSGIQTVKNNLEKCISNQTWYNNAIRSSTIEIENSVKAIGETEIKISVKRNEISDLESQIEGIDSSISHYKDKINEYGWFTSWWYKNEKQQLKDSLADEERKKNKKINEKSKLRNEISSFQEYIKNEETKRETQKANKTQYERNLAIEKSNFEIYTSSHLKVQRDGILNNIINPEINSISKSIKQNQIEQNTNRGDVYNIDQAILRENGEIKHCLKEIENSQLTIYSYQKKIADFNAKINKLKESLKQTENISIKIFNPILQTPKVMETQILSDEQHIDLMRLCDFNDQRWVLLYKASRDGFKAQDFHDRCNGFCNTLTLIKTVNSSVFGGYTGSPWSNDGGFLTDPYSFIFSLVNTRNQKLVIKCSEPSKAIYCNQEYGPCFGDDDIKISNESNVNLESKSDLGYSYEINAFKHGSTEAKTLLAGSYSFQIAEIEVYHKDYNKLSLDELKEYSSKTKNEMKTVLSAYETFHTIAINGFIGLESFINYLIYKINVFRNDAELNEMKKLIEYIFNSFDEDKSGELEFNEFLPCYLMFDSRNKDKMIENLFGFIFELGDKDNSKTLEENEMEFLFKEFPIIFNKNKLQYTTIKKMQKDSKLGGITKNEFLSLFKR